EPPRPERPPPRPAPGLRRARMGAAAPPGLPVRPIPRLRARPRGPVRDGGGHRALPDPVRLGRLPPRQSGPAAPARNPLQPPRPRQPPRLDARRPRVALRHLAGARRPPAVGPQRLPPRRRRGLRQRLPLAGPRALAALGQDTRLPGRPLFGGGRLGVAGTRPAAPAPRRPPHAAPPGRPASPPPQRAGPLAHLHFPG